MPLSNVIIIGGGLGGLCLAQALSQKNIPYTLHERDPASTHRDQGAALGLNTPGPESLQKCLPPQLYAKLDTFMDKSVQGRSFDMVDGASGKELARIGVEQKFGGGWYVDRPKLRDVLAEGVKIHYGKAFKNLEDGPDGVTATFEDGTTVTGSILIGCDGTNSLVRPFRLPSDAFKPQPVGVHQISAIIHDIDWDLWESIWSTSPDAVKHAGGRQRAWFMQCFGTKGSVMFLSTWDVEVEKKKAKVAWSLGYSGKEALPKFGDKIALKSFTLDRMRESSFHPTFMKLFEATKPEDCMGPRAVTSMPSHPPPIPPTKTPHVTLLGDAAHTMTSNAGMGGNTAFADAASLADQLELVHKGEKTVEEAVRCYEEEMWKRGFEMVKLSFGNTKRMHTESYVGEVMRGMFTRAFGWWLEK